MKSNDLFDVNGADKLNEQCVSEREEIIEYHAKNPKCLFFISLSGGKDSQAQYIKVQSMVPKERIVVIHANLGAVEHDGVIEHIKGTIDHELHVEKMSIRILFKWFWLAVFPKSKVSTMY